MTPSRASSVGAVAIVLLLTAVVGLQAAREHLPPRRMPAGVSGNLMYVRSPEVMSRAALSYRLLLADVYWIRALQHFGRARQSEDGEHHYDLLYPLLDLTTSLDPKFNVAYRFGSIFLTEPPPGGPGRPDLAIALLEKGLAAQPIRWELRRTSASSTTVSATMPALLTGSAVLRKFLERPRGCSRSRR